MTKTKTSHGINFNFIMILFYLLKVTKKLPWLPWFQFHYDLILLMVLLNKIEMVKEFQFHYDLILF